MKNAHSLRLFNADMIDINVDVFHSIVAANGKIKKYEKRKMC